MSGTLSFHSGLTAEEAVQADYIARGFRLLAQRWRGEGGEIDMIVESETAGTVFVEVKTAASLSDAAARLSDRQLARIQAASAEYLALAVDADVSCRIDLALVDRTGRIEIIENVTV